MESVPGAKQYCLHSFAVPLEVIWLVLNPADIIIANIYNWKKWESESESDRARCNKDNTPREQIIIYGSIRKNKFREDRRSNTEGRKKRVASIRTSKRRLRSTVVISPWFIASLLDSSLNGKRAIDLIQFDLDQRKTSECLTRVERKEGNIA